MTITVFDIRDPENRILRGTPEHKKPSFTDVAIKIGLLRVRIMRLRNNLNSFDKALDDMHDCIMELEEVIKTSGKPEVKHE